MMSTAPVERAAAYVTKDRVGDELVGAIVELASR